MATRQVKKTLKAAVRNAAANKLAAADTHARRGGGSSTAHIYDAAETRLANTRKMASDAGVRPGAINRAEHQGRKIGYENLRNQALSNVSSVSNVRNRLWNKVATGGAQFSRFNSLNAAANTQGQRAGELGASNRAVANADQRSRYKKSYNKNAR